MSYRFGKFLYDPVERVLLGDGVELPLTHKNRELLLLFLENPRRLLTREKIVENVWGDAAVTDDALRAQIAKLRRALGDAGDGLVEMVRREGYRWNGDVRMEAEAEALAPARPAKSAVPRDAHRFRLVLEDREVQLLEGPNVIGRDSRSALWIEHFSVSRRHAQVVVERGRARLEDLESKNGTFLNGRRIARSEPLADGDEIRIGVARIVLRSLSRLQSTRSEREP